MAHVWKRPELRYVNGISTACLTATGTSLYARPSPSQAIVSQPVPKLPFTFHPAYGEGPLPHACRNVWRAAATTIHQSACPLLTPAVRLPCNVEGARYNCPGGYLCEFPVAINSNRHTASASWSSQKAKLVASCSAPGSWDLNCIGTTASALS